jgi:hypothetical protein
MPIPPSEARRLGRIFDMHQCPAARTQGNIHEVINGAIDA